MFVEIKKYNECGHFLLKKGESLRAVSQGVPDKPGVYYMIRMARGKVDLVYIGKSGSIQQNGTFKNQLLNGRINNKQDGVKRQIYFDNRILEEQIDALDIYWFVTLNKENNDLPGYVEGLLMQRFYEVHGRLPEWNKDF